jgi:tetratricopeptide (TPR) repeat protein
MKRSAAIFGIVILLCIATLTARPQTPPADASKLWALVIGISHYQSFEQLRFAATDGKALADFLTSPRGGGIPADHITTLYEGEATQYAVRMELGKLKKKTQRGDTIYVFIAGHGYTEGNIGFFVPAEGTLDDIDASGVPFTLLKDFVEANLVGGRTRIFMMDICNSGRIGPEETSLTRKIQNLVNEELFKFNGRSNGTFLNLLASKPNQASFESEELGQGVFTYALLDALNGKASPPGSVVDAKSVVDYVQSEVPRYTKEHGVEQNPMANSDYDPKLPLAFLNQPGPMRDQRPLTSLTIRNANRAALSRVEWFDNRFRAKAVRALPEDTDAVDLEALPTGDLAFHFVTKENVTRSINLKLETGKNTLDILNASLTRYNFTPGIVQIASAAPVALPVPQAQAVTTATTASILVRLTAGSAVTVDGVLWGAADSPDQYLQVAGLTPGIHVLSISPNANREYRFRLNLFAGTQVFDLETGNLQFVSTAQPDPAQIPVPAGVPAGSVNAYRQFIQALWEDRLILPAGNSAWDYYLQLRNTVPAAIRDDIETRITIAMGNRAGRTILKYLRGGDIRWSAAPFDEGTTLINRVRQLAGTSPDFESREAFFQGRALIERGQYPEAVQQLQRSVTLNARASHAHNAIGLALWKQSQLNLAIPSLEQAIQLTPQWTYPRNTLALIYLEQRRYNEAEQQFQQSLQIKNEDSNAHHGLAQIYLLTNRLADAETQLLQAIAFNPGNAFAYETYGHLQRRRGNLPDAERLYRLAIRLEPDVPAFYVSLADLLRQQGRAADAQGAFNQAATQEPAGLALARSYPAFLIAENRTAEAQTYFDKAVKVAAKDSNLHVLYAAFLKGQKKSKDAEKELKTAINLSQLNPYAHYELATLYLEQKPPQIASAEKELDLASKADPRFPKTPTLIGRVRLAQMRYAEAVDQLEKARGLAIDAAEIQEIEEVLDTARRGSSSERINVAKAGRPAETWTTYAAGLKQNPDDRAMRDAILQFSLDRPEAADVSKLPPALVTDALKTNFWRDLQRAEQLWNQKNRGDAEDVFSRAVENLNDAERRIITATPLNAGRNAPQSIHQIVYTWASRLIEDNKAARAITLMETSIRQNIFGLLPNAQQIKVDSLMWPSDVETPKTFSDYEVVSNPDRRAHEIFLTAYFIQGDAARARTYLAAVETDGPNASLRLAAATALDRAQHKTEAIALLQEALAKRQNISADDLKKLQDTLNKIQKK